VACRAPIEGAVAAGQDTLVDQGAHDGRAELPGQMVIARPGRAHGVGTGTLTQGAHRGRRSQPGQGLKQLTDLGAGQPVVAVTALPPHPQELRLDELGQVRAGGRGGHPGLGRQGGGSQGPAVTQGKDHPGPPRVSQHSGHRSNVGISSNLSHTINPTRPTLRSQAKQQGPGLLATVFSSAKTRGDPTELTAASARPQVGACLHHYSQALADPAGGWNEPPRPPVPLITIERHDGR
jgi:hypothetical protein